MAFSTMNDTTFTGESNFSGTLVLPGQVIGELPKTNLKQRVLAVFPIPFHLLKRWDALEDSLPQPSAGDDLGIYTFVFGTTAPKILTRDIDSLGAVTHYARVPDLVVPPTYDTGETIRLMIRGGVDVNLAQNSATLDVEVFVNDGNDGYSGVDRYVGAALDINSLTWADKLFDLGTGLAPGDHLDIRIAVITSDDSGGSVVQAGFTKLELQCDTR